MPSLWCKKEAGRGVENLCPNPNRHVLSSGESGYRGLDSDEVLQILVITKLNLEDVYEGG